MAATTNSKGSSKKKSEKGAPPAERITGLESILKREPSLKTTLQQIEKQFGEGSIMPLGGEAQLKIEGIKTGSLSLDMALGGVGIPRGRIIEIFGPESSGKTTIALHICAQAQKEGGIAAIIDAEHAFDPSWGKKLGIDLHSLLVSQPSSGEEALQITEMLVKSNAVDVIVIDTAQDQLRSSGRALAAFRRQFAGGADNATTLIQMIQGYTKASESYRNSVSKHNSAIAELYRYSAQWPESALAVLQRRVQQLTRE